MKSIEQKIQNLRKKLNRWAYIYYIQNESEVSDEKYDTTLKKLRQLELHYPNLVKKNSPTQCIGSIPKNDFCQIHHKIPMLSLNSIIYESQLLLFNKRVTNKLHKNNNQIITYCCELKLDGIAISLLYKRGKLVQAATRGNGQIGEDVTKNAQTIPSIPMYLQSYNNKLPYLLEVRGEIFISKLCFAKLNNTMLEKGYKTFSNSRNAASGSLRQLDPNVTALRPLSFCCYGISYHIGEEILPNSHRERLLLCNDWGLSINKYIQLIQGIDESLKYYNYIKKIRSTLEYNIDGVVIKVDNCNYQDKLSCGSRAPNWAIAYKFPAESKSTKLNKVIFKVGRTGLITPIAYVDPVVIDNVIIKKINIHNINEVKRFNLMIGDTVLVQRSGDVIPKILEVVLSKRTHEAKTIILPRFCPICGSVLKIYRHKSSVLRCTNKFTCLAQRKAVLKHFVSRQAMNIRGIGEKIIDQLVNKSLIRDPIDFFYLNKEKLLYLDRYGIKSSERLLRSINFSKKTTLANFIYALGIPNVGLTIANNLAIEYKSIEKLIVADLQSLSSLQYIGKIVATDIYYFFKNPKNLKNIQDLIHPDIGISMDPY